MMHRMTMDELNRALKRKDKSADDLSIKLIRYAGDYIVSKLAQLYTQFFLSCRVPRAWKNAMVLLTHRKVMQMAYRTIFFSFMPVRHF